MKLYKYYTLRRPPAPRAIPTKGLFREVVEDPGTRKIYKGTQCAWGYALYTRRLEPEEIERYGLVYGGRLDEETGRISLL